MRYTVSNTLFLYPHLHSISFVRLNFVLRSFDVINRKIEGNEEWIILVRNDDCMFSNGLLERQKPYKYHTEKKRKKLKYNKCVIIIEFRCNFSNLDDKSSFIPFLRKLFLAFFKEIIYYFFYNSPKNY